MNKIQQEEELSFKLFVVLTRALDCIKKRVVEDIKCLGLNSTEFAVLELIYGIMVECKQGKEKTVAALGRYCSNRRKCKLSID